MSLPIEGDRGGMPADGDDSWAPQTVENLLRRVRNGESLDNLIPKPQKDPSEVSLEEAKEILGDNFFGLSELGTTTQFLQRMGVPISACWRNTVLPRRTDIEFARDHDELAVYLPSGLMFGKMSIPATINNVSGIFERIYGNYGDDSIPVLRDIWYSNEYFAGNAHDLVDFLYFRKQPLAGGELEIYMKDLEKSQSTKKKTFYPSALEVVLTEMVYYSNRQKILFPAPVRTRSLTNDNLPVYFNGFNARGIALGKGLTDQGRYYPVR